MSFHGLNDADLRGVAKDLRDFAQRVAKDREAKPAELEILPEIAKILFEIQSDL